MKWYQIAAIFLVGVLVGGLAGNRWVHRAMRHWRSPADMREHRLNRFSSRLKLNPDQRAQVKAIFEKHQPQMDAVFAETRAKIEPIRNETRTEIMALLNPEQQERYKELDQEMQERLNRRFPNPSPAR